MEIGIRQKLNLGFGAVLAVVAVMGIITLRQIDALGRAIDVILKENYRSVVACQNMKEALERMDSGVLFTLAGNEKEGRRLITLYAESFQTAMEEEARNITLPFEREKSDSIRRRFADYMKAIPGVTDTAKSEESRQAAYFAALEPIFRNIKDLAQAILDMNQNNMNDANNAARERAAAARRHMMNAMVLSGIIAFLFSVLSRRWILIPITKLTEFTRDVMRGNLDLVLDVRSADEMGRLAASFNDMTAALRAVRKEDRITHMRTRKATEEIFKALPLAMAVLDPDGRVDITTVQADRLFGLKPGILAGDLEFDWLLPLLREALEEKRAAEMAPESGYVQRFEENRELFFQPMAVPIFDGPGRVPAGTALILKDVTQAHEQAEIKRGLLATVSHQLKTPLTSFRMAVHILLSEKLGHLSEKQSELLVTARDESGRLAAMIDDLLDIQRMASGKSRVSPVPVLPDGLVREGLEPFTAEARDRGIALVNDVAGGLSPVLADLEKIRHVFANLVANAIRFTPPGGSVTVRALESGGFTAFLVEDTGPGIPQTHLARVFEPFFRAPGQDGSSGAGLGLAIVKEIVTAHGGSVTAESPEGRGSVMGFTLPVSREVIE